MTWDELDRDCTPSTRRQRWALHRFGVPREVVAVASRDQAARLLELLVEIVRDGVEDDGGEMPK